MKLIALSAPFAIKPAPAAPKLAIPDNPAPTPRNTLDVPLKPLIVASLNTGRSAI